jgi:RHS repeat-associated protein
MTSQLSENSHRGFDGIKAALCLGSTGVKSNTASGMQLRLRQNCTGSRSSGKERDAETGLDFFLARYYSPAQGRFLSPDEFKGGIVDPFTGKQISQPGPLPYADIRDPQTLSKYVYVRNNPLRYIDPDGHDIYDYELLTEGPNQVPNAPHPEVGNISTLGPHETPTGGYFLLNTQAKFEAGDNPADYKPIRTAYILGQKPGEVLEKRSDAQENPSKNQIANKGSSQFVYDSPGASANGKPKATLNGTLDVAFSLTAKNTKTKEMSATTFYYQLTVVYEKGSMVSTNATKITKNEFDKLIGQ